jgi:protein-L-isoaspartate O-methyltransferase
MAKHGVRPSSAANKRRNLVFNKTIRHPFVPNGLRSWLYSPHWQEMRQSAQLLEIFAHLPAADERQFLLTGAENSDTPVK